jgi:hypothetical protein
LDDRKPPPTLDYGRAEPKVTEAARVTAERIRQDHLYPLRYWVEYYGGSRYLAVASLAGVAVSAFGLSVAPGDASWQSWLLRAAVPGVVVACWIVRLRPYRNDW